MVSYAERPWTKNYDEGVPHTLLPHPAVPVFHYVQEVAREHPKSTVLLTTAKVPVLGRLTARLTYIELDRQSDAIAAALVAMGLKKGDRVAIVMPNCVAFVIAFFAILKAGGVVAATNPTYPPDKMAFQINDCDAEFVFTLTLFYKLVKQIQPQTKVKHIIVSNIKEYFPPVAKVLFTLAREKKDGHRLDGALQHGDEWFQDVLKRYTSKKAAVTITPDDLALFQYTGGTTGVSKGAMSTHAAVVSNIRTIQYWTGMAQTGLINGQRADELVYLGAIPMFHAYGLVAVLVAATATGCSIVLIPNPRDIDDVVDMIAHFKPNVFPGVPALFNAINNHPRVKSAEVSLASIQLGVSGSAPLPSATKKEFETLSKSVIIEGFGMSETPVATHNNPFKGEHRPKSIGLPFPDIDCRVVSLGDSDMDVPVGDPGELLISGPNIMRGYHGMPTETANALRKKDGKVWLHTGDIVYMDQDGYFYVVDRKKDMALIGGFNVYPAVVEDVIKSHPAVLEVGVAAVPHPEKEGQEALKAWIVLKPGMKATDQDIIAHCGTRLAPYEIPRRISFIKELPKTTVGKTLRRELIRLENQGELEKV